MLSFPFLGKKLRRHCEQVAMVSLQLHGIETQLDRLAQNSKIHHTRAPSHTYIYIAAEREGGWIDEILMHFLKRRRKMNSETIIVF